MDSFFLVSSAQYFSGIPCRAQKALRVQTLLERKIQRLAFAGAAAHRSRRSAVGRLTVARSSAIFFSLIAWSCSRSFSVWRWNACIQSVKIRVSQQLTLFTIASDFPSYLRLFDFVGARLPRCFFAHRDLLLPVPPTTGAVFFISKMSPLCSEACLHLLVNFDKIGLQTVRCVMFLSRTRRAAWPSTKIHTLSHFEACCRCSFALPSSAFSRAAIYRAGPMQFPSEGACKFQSLATKSKPTCDGPRRCPA